MRVAGLARCSTVDFPGELAAVVFTPGCNFDCFYCHNRTLLGRATPSEPVDDVLEFLGKRRGRLDAVVLSGGEPTLQPGLADFLAAVRGLGYRIKLDTNGSRPEVLEDLVVRGLLDFVAVDFKAPWTRYPELCGAEAADAEAVARTLGRLPALAIGSETRTTLVPQLARQDLEEMARSIPVQPRWILQSYRKPTVFRPEDRFRVEARPYDSAQMLEMAEAVRPIQPHVMVRM